MCALAPLYAIWYAAPSCGTVMRHRHAASRRWRSRVARASARSVARPPVSVAWRTDGGPLCRMDVPWRLFCSRVCASPAGVCVPPAERRGTMPILATRLHKTIVGFLAIALLSALWTTALGRLSAHDSAVGLLTD